MKLYQKKYTIYTILVFVILLIGCSNPESRKEAQKLIEKQAKVLNDVKKVEEDYYKIQSISDSLKNEQLKLIEKKDEVKNNLHELDTVNKNVNHKITDNKQNELNKQITDLEKQLEIVNSKLKELEKRDSVEYITKDTVYVQFDQKIENDSEEDTQEKGIIEDSGMVKTNEKEQELKNQEKLLKILNNDKDITQEQENNSKNETESIDKKIEDTIALKKIEEKIIVKSAEIDSFKKEVADEAQKISKKQLVVKEKKTKSVSKMTKVITIIIALGLVMFIVLYLVGKQGLSKKK